MRRACQSRLGARVYIGYSGMYIRNMRLSTASVPSAGDPSASFIDHGRATTAPWGTPAQQQHQQHMQAALDALLRGEEPAPLLAASGPLSPLLLIISLDFSLVLDLIRCVRGGLLFPHTYTFNLSSFSFSPRTTIRMLKTAKKLIIWADWLATSSPWALPSLQPPR